jgi:hypothetical protein
MKGTRRSLWSYLAVGAVLVLLAVVATGVWFFSSHRRIAYVDSSAADAEFTTLRSRFSNQQPLLDMLTRQARRDGGAAGTTDRPHAVHTVIFDTREGNRLVRMDVPYWFARAFGRRGNLQWLGQLSFLDDTEFDPDQIQLSWAEIDRHGPGLIVDYHHPSSGGQFICWVD